MARRMSRSASRSAMAWRLSCVLRPLAEAELDLGPAVLEVDGQRDEREVLLGRPGPQLARSRGGAAAACAGRSGRGRDAAAWRRRRCEAVQPHLAAVDAGEGVGRSAPCRRAATSPRCRAARGRPRSCRGSRSCDGPCGSWPRPWCRSACAWGRGSPGVEPVPPLALRRRAAASPSRPARQMVGHAYDGLPDEACGLLGGGPPAATASTVFYPCRNAAASSRVYTVDPKDHLRGRPRRRGPRASRSSA